MAELSGSPNGRGRRFAVVASRFNEIVTQKRVDGALDALVRHGAAADDVDLVWVPGAWELPSAARRLLASDRYSAVVAVGAVIRGETPHFDYVAGEAARGLADASVEFETPIGFGVLTCDTMAQAQARAGGDHGNKGWDAAVTHLVTAASEAVEGGPRKGKRAFILIGYASGVRLEVMQQGLRVVSVAAQSLIVAALGAWAISRFVRRRASATA
jgi:6,7-dimethyl-8-ribityllumazine synthase